MEEIKITEILKNIKRRKLYIFSVTFIFTILGLVVALTTPAEWRANNTIVTLSSTSGSGIPSSLGSLAGIAGISIPQNSSGELNPLSYEDILKSDFFISQLSNAKYYSSDLKDSLSLLEYHKEYLESSLVSKIISSPSKIMSLFSSTEKTKNSPKKNSNYLYISPPDQLIYDDVSNRLSVQYDKIKTTLSVSFKYQDPEFAAQVINYSTEYLDRYIFEFQQEEQLKKYDFIKRQIVLREKDYIEAEQALSQFLYGNQNLSTNLSRAKENNLQSKRDLAFDLYSSLQKNLQELEVSMASNKANVKTLGKTKIPIKKASTSKKVVILLYFFFGITTSLSFFLVKDIILKRM